MSVHPLFLAKCSQNRQTKIELFPPSTGTQAMESSPGCWHHPNNWSREFQDMLSTYDAFLTKKLTDHLHQSDDIVMPTPTSWRTVRRSTCDGAVGLSDGFVWWITKAAAMYIVFYKHTFISKLAQKILKLSYLGYMTRTPKLQNSPDAQFIALIRSIIIPAF